MGNQIGCLIKNISDKIKCLADANLKSHHLTLSQSRILAYLSENGGEATQKEIEVYLQISHPTVVGIISRMVRNDYLTCRVDMANRRNKLVRLTERAVSVRGEILARMQEDQAQMLRGLTQEETETLKRLLTVIYQNVEGCNKKENDDD